MEMIVKEIAALPVSYLGDVIAWRVNVKVDVRLDGSNLNVTQGGTWHCLFENALSYKYINLTVFKNVE